MRYIADFHIHSKYSRATSKTMTLDSLNIWAKLKGINIIGTGDFTHPVWFEGLRDDLQQNRNGLYVLKSDPQSVFFIPTAELSCIYKKNNKVRRIHVVIFLPNLESVEKFNKILEKDGYNLKSDGRPILGIDAKELLKIVLDVSKDALFVPAHIYTPWFSVLGASSGFNSVEECFEELTPQIFALETGLSSDPEMSWTNSKLDRFTLISNSDAHNPENLGREANVFDLDKLSYVSLIEAIKNKKNFSYTIEFFPEEGKYHLDGHRACGIVIPQDETARDYQVCPVCGTPLTVGVFHRVKELADRKVPTQPALSPNFKKIIPLKEIIAQINDVGKASKKVASQYLEFIRQVKGGEFEALLNTSEDDLKKVGSSLLAEAIVKMREGKVTKQAGYDGVYGKITILTKQQKACQADLF